MTINLGDKVKDTVTGFTGIAVARTTWLHGCDRITVQPPLGKDGKLPESATFDDKPVVLVKAATMKTESKKPSLVRLEVLNRTRRLCEPLTVYMTPAAFCIAYESLYGPGWQSTLARDLVRDIRTIRRWKTGESPVPKVVQEWLREQTDNRTLRRINKEEI